MLKPFPNYQKEKASAILRKNNKNKCYTKYYSCCHHYYHSHFYQEKKTAICFQKGTLQNPFFIIIVALLSLCAVTVSGVVTPPSSPTPHPPLSNTTFTNLSSAVHHSGPPAALPANDDSFTPNFTYANESWWPTSIPSELFHSNRGTLQQQIIGVPPSWGVGCPTPGSTTPVRTSSNNNTKISSNKLNYMIKMEEAENDSSPYYRCPKPCQIPSSSNNNNNYYNKNSSTSSSMKTEAANNNNNNVINNNNNNIHSSNTKNEQQENKHPPYFNQCLHYLQPSDFETLCKTDNQSISEFGRKISKLHLPFCCEHTVESVVMASLEEKEVEDSNVVIDNNNNNNYDDHNNGVPVNQLRNFECKRHLESLLTLDSLARKATALFISVLERYDCGQTYSVHFRCEDCKDAYRRWVCASLLPYHEPRRDPGGPTPPPEPSSTEILPNAPEKHAGMNSGTGRPEGHRRRGRRKYRKVRPCRSVCQQVEQRCPFFLPGDRAPGYTTQYAGEPTFLCLDPNIPETGEQFLRSAYGPDECCFRYCDTADSVAVMLTHYSSSNRAKTGLRHGVCSTTTACDQQELLLNYNKINNNYNRIHKSPLSSLTSSTTSSSSHDNTNNNNKQVEISPHSLQCSQLTNEEKVKTNCAVSPQSSSSSFQKQQSVKNNNNNPPSSSAYSSSPHHHEIVVNSFQEEKNEKTSSSYGDVITSRSAGVSFHIHYLNKAALVASKRREEQLLLLLLHSNNDNNYHVINYNNSITISDRLSPSSLIECWWFSIVTVILRIIYLSCYFLALLPYMLLFLLVHTGLTDGYL